MQYPWPYPYWPQQPPTPTAPTIPIHPAHTAAPSLQPQLVPTMHHMPQPTWQPTPLPQFQPPLQLTVPVPQPQAYPVTIPIPQQEPLPSQPPTLVPQHQPPHPHPATQVQHPSSPTGQTAQPPWDYSQGVWQPYSVFPPVAHPTTGAPTQAQTHPLPHHSKQQLQTHHHLPTQQQGAFKHHLLQHSHLKQTNLHRTSLPSNLPTNRARPRHQPQPLPRSQNRSNRSTYPPPNTNHSNPSRPPLHHHHHRHH